MAKALHTTYKLTFAPDMHEWPVRTINKAIIDSNKWLGRFWFGTILRGMFTAKGAQDAGIGGRNPAYDRFKRRRSGMAIPNVGVNTKGHAGGTLRRQMLSGARLSASSKRMRAVVQAPAYVNQRGRDGRGPDKINELTTISPKWQKFIAREFTRRIGRFLANEPKKRKFKK